MRLFHTRGLEKRLASLEDERAILRTMYTYAHAIDYAVVDEFVNCFTEDAELHWPGREPLRGEGIVVAVREHTRPPESYHKHLLVEPRITLNGDEATAESYWLVINRFDGGPKIDGFGRYFDAFRRCADGQWRFVKRRVDKEAARPPAS